MNSRSDSCLFCKIIEGEKDVLKIYEDDRILVFLDNNPDWNGHSLIIPKKHLIDTDDILKEEGLLEHILEVAEKTRQLLQEKLQIDGMTYLWNMGNAQNIKHFHMHIIPRDKTLNQQPKIMPLETIYKKIK